MSYTVTEAILDAAGAYGPLDDDTLRNTVGEQVEAPPDVILDLAQLLRDDGSLSLYDGMPGTFELTPKGLALAEVLGTVRRRENAAFAAARRARREAQRQREWDNVDGEAERAAWRMERDRQIAAGEIHFMDSTLR